MPRHASTAAAAARGGSMRTAYAEKKKSRIHSNTGPRGGTETEEEPRRAQRTAGTADVVAGPTVSAASEHVWSAAPGFATRCPHGDGFVGPITRAGGDWRGPQRCEPFARRATYRARTRRRPLGPSGRRRRAGTAQGAPVSVAAHGSGPRRHAHPQPLGGKPATPVRQRAPYITELAHASSFCILCACPALLMRMPSCSCVVVASPAKRG